MHCSVPRGQRRRTGRDPLYPGTAPGSSPANYPEKAYFSKLWNTEVVSNVTKPTLTVFKPSAETKNGTAAVICPGGGFMAISITSEGTDVAKFLTERGVTTFVLKYRLAHSGEDATQEFATMFADPKRFHDEVAPVIPLSIADGSAAVAYVRQHAADFGVAADRVGIIGFSAGGTVAAGAALQYKPEGRPAFVAPIYAAASMFKDLPVPADAPPIFIAAATDDNLGLAPTASCYMRNGWERTNPPKSTFTRKAATDSACTKPTSPPTTGSTA